MNWAVKAALVLLLTTPVVAAKSVETYDQKVRCLGEAVYRETRGESYRGQLAVAQTVINRTRHPRFPPTICGVVFHRGQFSWTKGWVRGDWRADHNSYQVARVALMGTHSLKNFKALYFHNHTVKPPWNKKFLARIGNHTFYV